MQPVTAPETKGQLDLLIKKYPDGKMTNFIHEQVFARTVQEE